MVAFSPVRQALAHEVVADHIRRAIELGRFMPGEKLPSERALAEQLGVSRAVLREAAKHLQDEGLITVRRGATGGMVVQGRDPAALAPEDLTDRMEQLERLYEFRLVNEGAATRLAARRRTTNDIAVLDDALGAMEAVLANPALSKSPEGAARFTSADSAFHQAIAAASRNPYLLNAVEDARARRFFPIGSVFKGVEADANDGHRQIFRAIEAGDGDAAEAAMTEHIRGTLAKLRAQLYASAAGGHP